MLAEDDVVARIADPDCRYEHFHAGEAPEPLVTAFLARESHGHLHADQLDWLFQRELCPGREAVPDFVHVVVSRSLRLTAQTAARREFEVEYVSKGTILIDNEDGNGTTVRWSAKESTLKRTVVLYRTNEGWKLDAPMFRGGEFLLPASALALYGRKLDEDATKDLTKLIR